MPLDIMGNLHNKLNGEEQMKTLSFMSLDDGKIIVSVRPSDDHSIGLIFEREDLINYLKEADKRPSVLDNHYGKIMRTNNGIVIDQMGSSAQYDGQGAIREFIQKTCNYLNIA